MVSLPFCLGPPHLHVYVLENLGLPMLKRIDGSESCKIHEFMKSLDFWKPFSML